VHFDRQFGSGDGDGLRGRKIFLATLPSGVKTNPGGYVYSYDNRDVGELES
jgi:hypothetical protein